MGDEKSTLIRQKSGYSPDSEEKVQASKYSHIVESFHKKRNHERKQMEKKKLCSDGKLKWICTKAYVGLSEIQCIFPGETADFSTLSNLGTHFESKISVRYCDFTQS